MAEDAEIQAQQTAAMQQIGSALSEVGCSAQEAATSLDRLAPILAQVFADALEDDELWRQRARTHGRLRTWWLCWQLRHMRRKGK